MGGARPRKVVILPLHTTFCPQMLPSENFARTKLLQSRLTRSWVYENEDCQIKSYKSLV
jgi:hypothetical protein